MSHDSVYKTRFVRELQCNQAVSPGKVNKVAKTLETMNQELQLGLADNTQLLTLVSNPYDCYELLTRVCTREGWVLGFIEAMIHVLRESSFLRTQQILYNGEATKHWESLFSDAREELYAIREGLNESFKFPVDPRVKTHQDTCVDTHDDGDSHTTHVEYSGTPEREEPEHTCMIDLTHDDDDTDMDVIDLTRSDMEQRDL